MDAHYSHVAFCGLALASLHSFHANSSPNRIMSNTDTPNPRTTDFADAAHRIMSSYPLQPGDNWHCAAVCSETRALTLTRPGQALTLKQRSARMERNTPHDPRAVLPMGPGGFQPVLDCALKIADALPRRASACT